MVLNAALQRGVYARVPNHYFYVPHRHAVAMAHPCVDGVRAFRRSTGEIWRNYFRVADPFQKSSDRPPWAA